MRPDGSDGRAADMFRSWVQIPLRAKVLKALVWRLHTRGFHVVMPKLGYTHGVSLLQAYPPCIGIKNWGAKSQMLFFFLWNI